MKNSNYFSQLPAFRLNEQSNWLSPKQPYISAVEQIAKTISNLEADFGPAGELRCLTTSTGKGLTSRKLGSTAAITAQRFLGTDLISRAFGLAKVALLPSKTTSFAFGQRVDFEQVSILADRDGDIHIRGGGISVFVNKRGLVLSVISSIKRGRKPLEAGRVISPQTAEQLAAIKFRSAIVASQCELILAPYQGRLQLAYEVTLESNEPRDIVSYLVLAKSGEIVDRQRKLLACCNGSTKTKARTKTLLCTPDPIQPISKQISTAIIKDLPDSKILANEHFAIFLGNKRQAVFAKKDGSYCYGINDPEFAAIAVFIALNQQYKTYAKLKMNLPGKVLAVFVNDPDVRDNAYFDPVKYEMHIGIGSGLNRGGLNKHIAFDLGVSNHEYGHNAVFLQTPHHDLPGLEGAALHEAIADILGTLTMDYLSRIRWAKKLGRPFTVADVINDPRIIGKYALPPQGIRQQRNCKRCPQDISGDPHDDGLVPGGALADLLGAMCTVARADLEDQIMLFAKLNLTALALVPIHTVTFRDMLRALVTADQLVTNGKYCHLIEQCFIRHGITFGATANRLRSAEIATAA